MTPVAGAVMSFKMMSKAEDHFKEEEDDLGNIGIHVHGEFKRVGNTRTREEKVRPRQDHDVLRPEGCQNQISI